MLHGTDTLAEKIAQHLIDRIVRMEIKSGERLLEIKIAEQLGVSQSPVREALRIMEKKHFVRIMPRHGTYVTEITEDFIISIYDIFQEMVGLATRKTVQKRTVEDMKKIREAFNDFEKAALSADVYHFNETFFRWGIECLKVANDPLLDEIIMDLLPSINRIQYISLSNRDSRELRDSIHKLARTTDYIEKGMINEAEMSNKTELEREKQQALTIFRQLTTGKKKAESAEQ